MIPDKLLLLVKSGLFGKKLDGNFYDGEIKWLEVDIGQLELRLEQDCSYQGEALNASTAL